MSLERFHEAQASRSAGYDVALAEIRRGRKTSHWIWYIFPQLGGLGHSSAARHYAIRDLDEARNFLHDPVLRARYREIAAAVHDQLARGVNLEMRMGSHLDALKLISSLTLVRAAAESITDQDAAFKDLAALCQSILAAAESQGYAPCARTVAEIGEDAQRDQIGLRLPAKKQAGKNRHD
jgi:uncharacterized protein (DUF1810 family)